MAEQGETGSSAVTSLNRAMADLYTPTAEAQAAMDRLGVSAYDENGNMRNFNTVIDDLNAALSGMGEQEANTLKATIFTSNGLKAFNKMTVTSTDKVNEWANALSSASGSAAAQAETMMDNLGGDITKLGSAFEGFQLTLYDTFDETLREVVQGLTDGVLPAITDMLNGVDGAEDALGEAFSGIVSSVVEEVPIGSMLSGIGNAVLSQAPELLEIGSDLVLNLADGIIAGIPAIADVLLDTVENMTEKAVTYMPELISAGADMIVSLTDSISETLPVLLPLASDAVITIVSALVQNAPEIMDAGLVLISSLTDGILQAISELLDALPTVIENLKDGFLSRTGDIVKTGVDLFTMLYVYGVVSHSISLLSTSQKFKDTTKFPYPMIVYEKLIVNEDICNPIELTQYHPIIYFDSLLCGNQGFGQESLKKLEDADTSDFGVGFKKEYGLEFIFFLRILNTFIISDLKEGKFFYAC